MIFNNTREDIDEFLIEREVSRDILAPIDIINEDVTLSVHHDITSLISETYLKNLVSKLISLFILLPRDEDEINDSMKSDDIMDV